jgi:hypothetical protein
MAMATTNYIDGVTQVADSSTLGTYTMPDPTQMHTWFDDFDDYVAAEWTITETGTGTRAVGNLANGILVITNAAADDDANFLQWSGATNAATVETWKFATGKRLWFKTKFKLSDATQSDFVMGLQITDTTPLAVTDGVYFLKADGSATLNLLVTKDSTSTTTAAATLVDDTYVTVGFVYDGKSTINIFVDDNRVASSVTTNLPDDEELTISFGVQNGEAVAKVLSLDYIMVSEDR